MICEYCGKEMQPHPYGQPKKYCSGRCRHKAELERYYSRYPDRKNASKVNPKRLKPVIKIACRRCGKEVEAKLTKGSQKKYCSETCRHLDEHKRYHLRYPQKRYSCDRLQEIAWSTVKQLKRLGKIAKPETCSMCGSNVGLVAHHHKGYDHPTDVVWLCHYCHSLVHGQMATPKPAPSLSTGVS